MTYGLPLADTGHFLVLEHNETLNRFHLVGHPDMPWVLSAADAERLVQFP